MRVHLARLLLVLGLLVAFPAAGGAASVRAPAADPGPTVTTAHDTVPNPVYGSAFRVAAACKGAVTPCAWESGATWMAGTAPDANTLVIVDGNVQIGTQGAVALEVGVYPGGTLAFDPAASTRLSAGSVVAFAGGTLTIGTAAAPVGDAVTAELVIRDLPFSNDLQQYLRGLLVLDGTLRVYGRAFDETFLRTTGEPAQNSATVTLAASALAAGWKIGDTVALPTSAQCAVASGPCADQTEDRTIAAVSPNGLTLTLNAPLQFAHPGGRSDTGGLDFLPHVLNETRNVRIRSENPNGMRGHVFLTGRADVDLRYAALLHLGRTNINDLGPANVKGRYPLHLHHLIGPQTPPASGYQFVLMGNVVDFGSENSAQEHKWGIAVHDSHYGLLDRNIVDHAFGAGIATEEANETGNWFRKNFVVRVLGGNGARTEDRDPGDGTKLGRAGVGYWFNGGGGNHFQDNVAAAVAECTYCYGFKFDNVYNGDVLIPNGPGADPHGGGGQTVDSFTIGLTDFQRNEAYAVPNGITIWWVCTMFEMPRDSCFSTLRDFHVWHHHRWGYFAYETNQMTIDGFVTRGEASILQNVYESVTGLYLVDYLQRRTVIRNADIQGMATGIVAPVNRDVRGATGPNAGITTVEDSFLSAGLGIAITSPSSTNGAADLSPQTTILRHVRFAHPSTRNNGDIEMDGSGAGGATSNNTTLRNDLWIYDFNRAPGVDGPDLYIVPTYQPPSNCDNTIGNCGMNLTANYPTVSGARVFPLLIGPPPMQPWLFAPLSRR